MAHTHISPEYTHATAQDVASLVNKLVEFSQVLSPVERALLLERIKRSMPLADIDATTPIAASPAVFAAWINSIVADTSRWYPPK